MKIHTADIVRIAGLVAGFGSLVTGQVLEAFGIPASATTHVLSIVGFVVAAASLISRSYANPSPPPGTSYAAIPPGTIPVVGLPTAAGGTQVAHIDPAQVAHIDPASTVVATIVPKS